MNGAHLTSLSTLGAAAAATVAMGDFLSPVAPPCGGNDAVQEAQSQATSVQSIRHVGYVAGLHSYRVEVGVAL